MVAPILESDSFLLMRPMRMHRPRSGFKAENTPSCSTRRCIASIGVAASQRSCSTSWRRAQPTVDASGCTSTTSRFSSRSSGDAACWEHARGSSDFSPSVRFAPCFRPDAARRLPASRPGAALYRAFVGTTKMPYHSNANPAREKAHEFGRRDA